MVKWQITSRDCERSNSWPQYAWSAISQKLLELQTSNLLSSFVYVMPSGRTNNFPWKWAWPRSRDPTIFGSTVGYPSDSLASCLLLMFMFFLLFLFVVIVFLVWLTAKAACFAPVKRLIRKIVSKMTNSVLVAMWNLLSTVTLTKRGYRGGSPTTVQAWQPCPLWEPSPSHPILV